MKELNEMKRSCIFAKEYTELQGRAEGRFCKKDMLTQDIKKFPHFKELHSIYIRELDYILEVFNSINKDQRNEFILRVFKKNEKEELIFITGRWYCIQEENLSMTYALRCALDDIEDKVNDQDKVNNKKITSTIKTYIIEEIISHLWNTII